MAERLGWGILGTGFIAETQVADLVGAGFRVAAVGSRTAEGATAFGDRFDIPNRHASYEALVADPDVDVIYVASPHSHHYRHTRLALEAGKHALVEKAFMMNAEQATVLVDLAEERGLVLLEAMWTRFLPHMVRIREIIAAGTLGEVHTLLADHTQSLPTDPEHRINNPALGGGATLDLGVYPISFAHDLFGTPASVTARATPTTTGVDAQTSVILGYASGAQAQLHFALDTAGPNHASVIGTEAWIDIEQVWYSPTAFTVRAADGTVIERFEQQVPLRGMQFQATEFERLVLAQTTAGDILPPSESVAVMATMQEILRQVGVEYPADIMGL